MSAYGNLLTLPENGDFWKEKKKNKATVTVSLFAFKQFALHVHSKVNHALTLVLCVVYTGGLGFSTDQIGTALLCVAGPMLVLQFWVYPKVNVKALVAWLGWLMLSTE